jgi:homocitrate synthase
MCGTDSNEANSQAPPNTSHPAQNHNPASSPYAQMQDYISNVNRYKIIESTLREGEQFANAFFTTENKYVCRFFRCDQR